ncbi:hypothetical protein ABTX60_06710 [Streptomyces sp. NPDC126510]|uniref:hypothetical protein n=1 Tax=Streptomyces sp. NPDC126510 TaxID=3155317 RepID=UPI00332711E3
MDDAVIAIILVLVAMAIGAVLLAVALLHRQGKKNRAEIAKLHAEVTAAKIAALTSSALPPASTTSAPPPLAAVADPDDEWPDGEQPDDQPVRRRRHLSLYLGGGIAAFFLPLIESARRAHRTVALAATAAVATVGGAAYITPFEMTPPRADSKHPAVTSPAPAPFGSELTPARSSDGASDTVENVGTLGGAMPESTASSPPPDRAAADETSRPAEQPSASGSPEPNPTGQPTTPPATPGKTTPGQADRPGNGNGNAKRHGHGERHGHSLRQGDERSPGHDRAKGRGQDDEKYRGNDKGKNRGQDERKARGRGPANTYGGQDDWGSRARPGGDCHDAGMCP